MDERELVCYSSDIIVREPVNIYRTSFFHENDSDFSEIMCTDDNGNHRLAGRALEQRLGGVP